MHLRRLASLALFTTLSLIIFTLESAIPPLVPIPGIKLGLANIITLILLRNYTAKDALLVLLARMLLSTFFFSQAISLVYSLSGGLLSLGVMALCSRLLQRNYTFLIGISGGLTHNLGVLVYLPFLILGGMLTGLFTGLCAHFAQKYLRSILNCLLM